jgi:hypothetical protein
VEPIYETAQSSLLQPKLEPVSNVLVLVDSHVPCPSPEGSKSGFAKEEKEVADEIQSAEVTDAKLKQTDAQVEQLEDEKGTSSIFFFLALALAVIGAGLLLLTSGLVGRQWLEPDYQRIADPGADDDAGLELSELGTNPNLHAIKGAPGEELVIDL